MKEVEIFIVLKFAMSSRGKAEGGEEMGYRGFFFNKICFDFHKDFCSFFQQLHID